MWILLVLLAVLVGCSPSPESAVPKHAVIGAKARPGPATIAPAKPTSPPPAAIAPARDPQIVAAQRALNTKGYRLPVDGRLGPKTQVALSEYQRAIGLPVTGKLDPATVAKLLPKPRGFTP